jgi:hypothetical protein
MARSFPRVTLFVPGEARDLEAWAQRLRRFSIDRGGRVARAAATKDEPRVDAEWLENDGAFGQAFSFGTVEPAGVERIDRAPGALLLSVHVDPSEGRRSLLEAAQTDGAPLTKARVERLRDQAVVMAVAPKDPAALERSRGCADLDPELVWEQWDALERARQSR